MNKQLKFLSILLIFVFSLNLNSQQGPKDLTMIEGEIEEVTPEEEVEKIESLENTKSVEEQNIEALEKNKEVTEDFINTGIIIDDIPKEFNNWYGVLSSKEGGLGWLMWGDTEYTLSLELLKNLPTNIYSPAILDLYSSLLLSRAKSPETKEKKINKKSLNSINEELIKYQYFDEKVRLMIELGLNKKIKLLEESIPLEVRNFLFERRLRDIRFNNIDIYYICENIQNKLKEEENKNFSRKLLISCNIANKKNSSALLALDLLENDMKEEDYFFKVARNLIENERPVDISFKNMELPINLILSLNNKEQAKEAFKLFPLKLDRLIYKMKLYEIDDQIESLERLVNVGLYDKEDLKDEYEMYLESIPPQLLENNDLVKDNSVRIRSYLFQKAMQSSEEVERARNLNLLWEKAKDAGIEKAISYISSEIVSSIQPESKLNWFTLTASKNLLFSNKTENAKRWLFYGKINTSERASLDPNFCKALITLYLKDRDIYLENKNLPEINFLLEILFNDINIDKKSLEKLMISLKAIGVDIRNNLWQSFIFNNATKKEKKINKEIINLQSLYFHLDYSLQKRNKAEVAIISIILLSDYLENENYQSLFNALEALREVDLEIYAREIAFEINSNFLR